jgi:hypothetical protein
MKIWLDTEFNGWGGNLISMGMIAENGQTFYEVLNCENPTLWVEKNVMPYLNKHHLSYGEFQYKALYYLRQFDTCEIYASWPDDFVHLLKLLVLGGGVKLSVPPLSMHMVVPTPETIKIMQSNVTHNALDDAKALKLAHP